MEFVAFVGKDKERWGQIKALINHIDCNRAFIVKDKETAGFELSSNTSCIDVDCSKPLVELKSEIMDKLKVGLSKDLEVCLSIASGTGKEHMALISALLSIPVGIRLVVFTKEGLQQIN